MKGLKIAFFTDTYLPNKDGVVYSMLNLKKELEKKGHKVYIFAPKSKESKKEKGVYYFKSAPFKPYPEYNIALFPFVSSVKICKELGIDIVHSHGLATTALAAMRVGDKLKIPKIITFHTMIPKGTHYLTNSKRLQRLLTDISWKYLRWLFKHFDKVIAPTKTIEKILNKQEIYNTTVISNPMDFKTFANGNREETRKRLRIDSKKVVLFVGRIVKEKKLELLIEVAPDIANKIKNIVFLIVGDGPALEYYKNLAKSKKVEEYFKFIGYVERKKLKDYYAAGDIFAITSDFETQGLVVLEALYSGLPVVAKADTAPAELIKPGVNGYIFRDEGDLAEKIEKALRESKKLKENTKQGLEQYDKKEIANKIEQLYMKLIKN